MYLDQNTTAAGSNK